MGEEHSPNAAIGARPVQKGSRPPPASAARRIAPPVQTAAAALAPPAAHTYTTWLQSASGAALRASAVGGKEGKEGTTKTEKEGRNMKPHTHTPGAPWRWQEEPTPVPRTQETTPPSLPNPLGSPGNPRPGQRSPAQHPPELLLPHASRDV